MTAPPAPPPPVSPSSAPRLLVLSGARWHHGALQLALAGRALGARGHAVTVVTPHADAWRDVVPRATIEPFAMPDGARALRALVTDRLEAARPALVLTDDDALCRIATRALPESACVLQRLPLGGEMPSDSFASRFAGRRAPLAWLRAGLQPAGGTPTSPMPVERRVPVFALPFASATADLPAVPASDGGGARTLLVLADPDAPLAAIPALRAAAAVARRERHLEIRLHGERAAVQALRVHAAALGAVAHVTVAPVPSLLDAPDARAVATWVAAAGDFAASATLWSFGAGVPVIADGESTAAAFVSDHVTGLLVSSRTAEDDAHAASGLSWLLAHGRASRLLGEAARRRAREYAPDHLADRVLDAAAFARRQAPR